MLKALMIVFRMVMLLLFVGPVFAQVDTAWVRRYNGHSDSSDVATAIAVDHSGNVYVTGYSKGSGTLDDYATIKYYPNGDTSWVRRYNGPGNSRDAAYAIAIDTSGNVYVTGRSYGSGTDFDYATIKYYPNGDTAWVRRYNGPGYGWDEAHGITVDDFGYIYVTGFSQDTYTFYDYTTIKYQANGDTVWVRRYDGPGTNADQPNAIAVDDSGNVYVTGYSWGSGTDPDCATIKYYPNGDTAWVRRYSGPGNSWDEAYAIALGDSGNVYVTGYIQDTYTFYDYATIKYRSNGDTAWVRRYNGPGNSSDQAFAMAVDDFGYIYVTGFSYSNETYLDYATIKYYPNGDTVWVRRYTGPGNNVDDEAHAIVVDDSGNVYVTGYSYGIGTDQDYATIKYSESPSGVEDGTQFLEKPSEFDLTQNYPNPFNPSTTIHFTVYGPQSTVHSSTHTTLKIYNMLGEQVRTLVDEPKGVGEYTVQWDGKSDKGEQLSSGVYFYELKAGTQTSAKKMILLK